MATNRQRTSLYLDREMVDRAMAVFNEMPGEMSLSRFIDQGLRQSVPLIEQLWASAKDGDRDAMLVLLDRTMLDGMGEAATMRTKLRNQEQEEPTA